MYSYDYDATTGGILLNIKPLKSSNEPRPVYYKELDILGFDEYWKYEKNDSYPYMWAEANNYFYKGRKVAKTKGGSVYTAPQIEIIEDPEPNGQPLQFVDVPAMVEKNKSILVGLIQDTIKKIYNTYVEYKDKIDVFYVAFSGGKDSIVTLDLVKRALPYNAFKVLFGDTGMEFPDTYDVVDKIEEQCKKDGIDLIRAKSNLKPEETWNKFGPPATVTRWCCSVHKTSPQIIALRNITKKPDFTGMAFIGVRASESLSRNEYDYISLGEKHKGQYSCNPILEWNSAEVYLYIFMEKLFLNEAYKKGNRRAGCLVCPRAAERNDFMACSCYDSDFNKFINIIKTLYKNSFNSDRSLEEFISNGGWKARKNGRDISIDMNYNEYTEKNTGIINIQKPNSSWREWIKTIGILINDSSPYKILFHGENLEFELYENNENIEVKYDIQLLKTNPLFIKLLKNVFRKTACCIQCHECEADCHNGCISMADGILKISDKCIHCSQCHKVEKGCLIYKSLQMPKGGLKMLANKSLNCYSHHAPKIEWFHQYFEYKNEFDQKHSLGSQMYSFFKRFLRDSELINENGFTDFAYIIESLTLNDDTSWALIYSNLVYTPQINWIVKRLNFKETYNKEYTISLLISDGAKESWVNDIWSSFSRLLELPFSHVGMGEATKEKNKLISIIRTPWDNPDARVILYSLYKFAEACGDYYSFTLSRLLDHNIDSDGVSPTEIFGLDRETMENLLNGLTINYPELIKASFTHGLDNITLNSEKTSKDILELF